MSPLHRVAIANRGEIAVRVARACRDLGLVSLLLCAEVDRDSLAARCCDEVHVMRGMAPRQAYLDRAAVVEAAQRAGADTLHPGYGFLSESPELAEACAAAGIRFVGPAPEHIRILGDKNRAREAMQAHGVPVVPGTRTPLADADDAVRQGRGLGYPLLLKASAGGGGRGMRLVRREADMASAFASAASESQTAFGSASVYLERYLERPRHVEVQVAADACGAAVHLFERECSIQRRFQKMVEEAPSPALDPETRRRITAAAVRGALGIGYRTLGTFEFLVDADGSFYFLEVNTRLQVEHPVTEAITGVDLVALQLRLAAGEPLPFQQEDLHMRGWAFEARITCEDPYRDFVPQPGRMVACRFPQGPGVRVDTGVAAGAEISPYFDSLVAKLIVHGATREEARHRMLRALAETRLEGVPTTIPFHQWVFRREAFARGELSTRFLDDQGWGAPEPSPERDELGVVAAALAAIDVQSPPAGMLGGRSTSAAASGQAGCEPAGADAAHCWRMAGRNWG